MMDTNRKDRRGHWPAGRRRNEQQPPKGWHSVDIFLAAVRDYCATHRKMSALARHLGVDRKTLYTWLLGDKWPRREVMLRIAKWYRQQRKPPA